MKPRRHWHVDQYEEQNRKAAAVILEDLDRYGGEESLAVRWARLVGSNEPWRPNGRHCSERGATDAPD